MSAAIEPSWAARAVIKDARRRQRRRRRRILATVAALSVAGAAWTVAANLWSARAPVPPPVTVEAVHRLHLGGIVQNTTTLGANVWALTCLRRCSRPTSAGELIELNARGAAIRRFPVTDPTAVVGGAGALWVAHFDTGQVSRVNPRTGRATATIRLRFAKPIGTRGWSRFEPLGLSYGAGRIWVSSPFGYVAEIDPRTARLQRMVFTSSEVTSATAAGGLTWVADELDGVGTFMARGSRVAVHHISWAREPVDVSTVAYGAGLVWALGVETNYAASLTNPPSVGIVTTLDPRTGRVIDQWRVAPEVSGLVLRDGSGYVGDDLHGRLVRLVPGHSVETLQGPNGARLTTATPGALWAISRDGQLLRIGLARR